MTQDDSETFCAILRTWKLISCSCSWYGLFCVGGELGEPTLSGSSLHKDQIWGAVLGEGVGLGSEGLHIAELLEREPFSHHLPCFLV